MTLVAVVAIHPGPLADLAGDHACRLVDDLERLAEAAPRALVLDARDGAGVAEPRVAIPAGLIDPATLVAGFPAPSVAVWDGPVVGAGADVVLAADICVIGRRATLAFPEVGQGELPNWGGTQRLTRAAGASLALRALVVGDALDADALAHAGVAVLVDDPVAYAEELAQQLASGAPLAQAAAREAVVRGRDLTMAEGHRVEADLNLLLSTTADRAEGIAAFFAKRPPEFRGE